MFFLSIVNRNANYKVKVDETIDQINLPLVKLLDLPLQCDIIGSGIKWLSHDVM